MKLLGKTIRVSIVLLTIQIIFSFNIHAFEDTCPQLPPDEVRVEGADGQTGHPVGYNEFDGYYVDLRWNVTYPVNPDNPVTGRFLNFYSQPVDKPYKPDGSRTVIEKDVAVPSGGSTYHRMKGFSPGTIYFIDVAAYHTHTTENGIVYKSAESVRQPNKIKVLTDIQLTAYSHGTNTIKIVWDDVWDVGKRINYKLYISENENFYNTQPVYISQSEIGPGQPVSVNENTGKLEYIHKVRDAGRVYYVKIEPDIVGDEIKRSPENPVAVVSSYILVKTTKMSSTQTGSIWRLDWSSVVTGLSDSDIKINYRIYRGIAGNSDLPQYMATVDGTTFFITQPVSSEEYYYIIRANVTKNGENVYPGVKIASSKITVKEEEVPAKPPSPELVGQFKNATGDVMISYQDSLLPDSALLLWRVPEKGGGIVDTDVSYDIWMVSDPSLIDDPPASSRIVSGKNMSEFDYIADDSSLLGCKYVFDNLTPNSTYYVKIEAEKTFVVCVDGKLKEVSYRSEPSFWTIITPSEGNVDRPPAPGSPPLKVKSDLDGNEMITEKSITLQVKNRWFEKFNSEINKWEYVETTKTDKDDIPEYDPVINPPDNLYYREVEYDEGIVLDVGCAKYEDGMSQNDIEKLIDLQEPVKLTGVPMEANDPYEDPEFNAPVSTDPLEYRKHNIDMVVNDLEPNSSYIIWVRAVRRRPDIVSEPSEPIIVTTRPLSVTPVEKPTIPVCTYSMAGDTYVDLTWNWREGYTYHIKYSKSDNIDSGENTITLGYENLLNKSFYRIEDLEQDTIYYFWIRAEVPGETEDEEALSDWSDSIAVKTSEYIPPGIPLGFGIKNQEDAVTGNSIFFEWLNEEGLEYVLEIAENVNYKDSLEIFIQNTYEYKVDGLRSNTRYYARLYSYDPERDLKSEATKNVVIHTKRNTDDYDSNQDTETNVTGNFVMKHSCAVNGTWNIEITGINVERFIEHIRFDKEPAYIIDLRDMPDNTNEVSIKISNRLFKALNTVKENIILSTIWADFTVRYQVFNTSLDKYLTRRSHDFEYIISINSEELEYPMNLVPAGEAVNIDITAVCDGMNISVTKLNRPLKVKLSYRDTLPKEKTAKVFVYNQNNFKWEDRAYRPDCGVNIIEPTMLVRAFEKSNNEYADIYGHKYESSIRNVLSTCKIITSGGQYFYPDKKAELDEMVRMAFDILEYNYGRNYMNTALRSGMIPHAVMSGTDGRLSRETAMYIAVRLYELKSGEKKKSTVKVPDIFDDLNKINAYLKDKVLYAIENAVLFPVEGNNLNPDAPVTRSEIMVLFEKILALCGEI